VIRELNNSGWKEIEHRKKETGTMVMGIIIVMEIQVE
jgi:hypothetical protein